MSEHPGREGASRKHRIDAPILRSLPRQLKSATLNDAGLNMTAALGMRDLAHRLLTYEAAEGETPELAERATLRVYEKIRQSLNAFAGAAAFESLAFRALTQAKSEAPSLWPVRIASDGSLQGLGEFEPQIDMDKDRADKVPVGDGGIVLIARLLGLLLMLLGEALTLSLLRNAWPGAAFEDHSSENGRIA
jgi:hypothetical protein